MGQGVLMSKHDDDDEWEIDVELEEEPETVRNPAALKRLEREETVLFSSVDKALSDEYIAWWASAFDGMLQLYKEAELDGSEDALRCRMIAAHRLAQLGACALQFFGSCSALLMKGKGDAQALNAVAMVTGDMVQKKVNEWKEKSNKSLN